MFFTILMGIANANAAETGEIDLPFSILVIADPSADIEEICCGNYISKFSPHDSGVIQAGYGKPAIWLRIPPINMDGILDFGILAEDITVFYIDPRKNGFQSIRNGKVLNIAERINNDPSIHFELTADFTRQPVFVKIIQETSVPIEPAFFAAEPFEEKRSSRLVVHALLIGAALIMMAFNLSLGIVNRDSLFILNMLTVAGAFIANLAFTGIGPSFVWGTQAGYSVAIFTFGTIASTAFASVFLFKFLDDPGNNSLVVRSVLFLPLLLIVPLLIWIVGPVWQSHIWFSLTNSTITIYAFLVLVFLFFRGNVRAKMILPTLILAIIPSNVMFVLNLFLQMDTPIPLEHLFEFLMVSEALLFSLILAYRIRLAQDAAVLLSRELQIVQANTQMRVLNSIDTERKRIASDLHDTAGQGLMSVATRLSRILRKNKLASADQEDIRKAADYSRSVIGDIRRISHELHPAVIDHLGWRNAIEELFGNLGETSDVSVSLVIDIPEKIMDSDQQLHFYRIIQELISNISKHSNANSCDARFYCENGNIYGEIRDNGDIELDTQNYKTGSSLGQLIIDQRIATLNGSWLMNREDNETVVSFSFPALIEPDKGR